MRRDDLTHGDAMIYKLKQSYGLGDSSDVAATFSKPPCSRQLSATPLYLNELPKGLNDNVGVKNSIINVQINPQTHLLS